MPGTQNTYTTNNERTLVAVSNADNTTPVNLWADPTTHALLTSGGGGGGSYPSNAISTVNSTTVVLTSGSVFTGTSEDVSAYADIRVSLISDQASATDGLSLQQSTDGTNWDFTDTYTITASTGKVFAVPVYARYFRVVYTNGGTNQASFRLQTVYHIARTKPSSQRPMDARSNENDMEENLTYGMQYDPGTNTWNRNFGGRGYLSVPFTTTTVQMVGTTDAANYAQVSVQINAQGTTSTVTFQGSNDNVNWVSVSLLLVAAVGVSVPVTTSTTVNTYAGGLNMRYFRLNVTGISALTTSGQIHFSTAANSQNTSQIAITSASLVPGVAATNLGKAEDAVHASGDTGVAVWGVRNDTLATGLASASGDYTGLATDTSNRLMVATAPRLLKIAPTVATITSSTAETTVLAALAATFQDVYGATFNNTSATATKLVLRDTTGGTIRWSGTIPAGDTRGFMLPMDAALPQATVNTNWTVQCTTSVASIEVTLFAVKMV